jgi:nicotinamide-nucleotide amidase
MAEGALRAIDAATWAIAVSGVAGPDGGTADKPVGTVWLAWARREEDSAIRLEARRESFAGGRDEVRRCTVRLALERLLAG